MQEGRFLQIHVSQANNSNFDDIKLRYTKDQIYTFIQSYFYSIKPNKILVFWSAPEESFIKKVLLYIDQKNSYNFWGLKKLHIKGQNKEESLITELGRKYESLKAREQKQIERKDESDQLKGELQKLVQSYKRMTQKLTQIEKQQRSSIVETYLVKKFEAIVDKDIIQFKKWTLEQIFSDEVLDIYDVFKDSALWAVQFTIQLDAQNQADQTDWLDGEFYGFIDFNQVCQESGINGVFQILRLLKGYQLTKEQNAQLQQIQWQMQESVKVLSAQLQEKILNFQTHINSNYAGKINTSYVEKECDFFTQALSDCGDFQIYADIALRFVSIQKEIQKQSTQKTQNIHDFVFFNPESIDVKDYEYGKWIKLDVEQNSIDSAASMRKEGTIFQKIPQPSLGKSPFFKDRHIGSFDVDLIKIEPEKTTYMWQQSKFNWGGTGGNEKTHVSKKKEEAMLNNIPHVLSRQEMLAGAGQQAKNSGDVVYENISLNIPSLQSQSFNFDWDQNGVLNNIFQKAGMTGTQGGKWTDLQNRQKADTQRNSLLTDQQHIGVSQSNVSAQNNIYVNNINQISQIQPLVTDNIAYEDILLNQPEQNAQNIDRSLLLMQDDDQMADTQNMFWEFDDDVQIVIQSGENNLEATETQQLNAIGDEARHGGLDAVADNQSVSIVSEEYSDSVVEVKPQTVGQTKKSWLGRGFSSLFGRKE